MATALLITVLPSLELLFYSLLYFKGLKLTNSRPTTNPLSNKPLVSIIIPVKNEPFELFERALKSIANMTWPKEKLEIIIISDDDKDRSLKLRDYINNLASRLNLNIIFYHRRRPRGGRTGALNDGLRLAHGKYVMTYDVDNVIEPNALEEAIKLLEQDSDKVAVVLRWKPLNMDTRVSEMQAYALDYLMDSLYRGFQGLGLPVFPLGSGTVYRKDKLLELNGWDEARIQDDMEIGIRIFSKGYKTGFIDNAGTKVELPPTIKALRIQQCRWSYGAMDALLSRLRHLLMSKSLSLKAKFLSIVFLLQYTPIVAATFGIILLTLLIIFNLLIEEVLFMLSTLSAVFTSLYIYSFIHAHKLRGRSIWSSLVMLGRSSAAVTFLAPWITWCTIRAILRIPYYYIITPKGKKAYNIGVNKRISSGHITGFIVAILLASFALLALVRGYYIAATPYILFLSAIIYVFYRWWNEL